MKLLLIAFFLVFFGTTDGVGHSRHRWPRHAFDAVFETVQDPDTSTCNYERANEVFKPEDLRMAHGGIFRDIRWTREERLAISDLHTTQQYHLLGPLLKQKLDSMDVDEEYRKQVAEFFAEHYPPEVVRKLHSNESKCRIRKLMSVPKVDMIKVLKITANRILELDDDGLNVLKSYIKENSRPRIPGAKEDLATL